MPAWWIQTSAPTQPPKRQSAVSNSRVEPGAFSGMDRGAFWKRPKMLDSLQETVLGMRNEQQRGRFSWGLETRALFPLYLYRSFVALKGSSYSGWETTLLLRPAVQLAAPWDIGFLGAAQLCTKVHSGLRGKVLELPTPKPKELLPAHVSAFPSLSPPSSTAWEPVSEPEKGTWRRRREEKGREGGRQEWDQESENGAEWKRRNRLQDRNPEMSCAESMLLLTKGGGTGLKSISPKVQLPLNHLNTLNWQAGSW